jgi:hypothetical protein
MKNKPKYGTPEYKLIEAKKNIDEALIDLEKIRSEIGIIETINNITTDFKYGLQSYFNSGTYRYWDENSRNHIE